MSKKRGRKPKFKTEEERKANDKQWHKNYYENNKEMCCLRSAIYRLDHPRYYKDNKDVILFKRKWKYKTDPVYRQQCIESVKRYRFKKKVCQILRILGNLVSHKERQSSTNTRK